MLKQESEESNAAYNNALSYTIATSEYRSLLHGVAMVQAMSSTEQVAVMQERLTQLEDALRYELSEVFDVTTDKGELAKMPLVSFSPEIVKELNEAYNIGLGQVGESRYPLFTEVAKIRSINPNTVASHGLITLALSGIETQVKAIEEAHIDGDIDKVDDIIHLISQWTDVLICHPKDYRNLGNLVLLGLEGCEAGFTDEFIELFLSSLTDVNLPMVFGDEALKLILKENNKLN